MPLSRDRNILFSWTLIILVTLPIAGSTDRSKQKKQENAHQESAVDKADSRILWQFDTGG